MAQLERCANFITSGLYYKSSMIIMTVQWYGQYYKTINYDRKVRTALASVINYDRKSDAIIWSINLI